MTKRQLIDEIRNFNTTAQPRFLVQFDEAALKQYLEHLQSARNRQVLINRWHRREPGVRMVS